MKAAVIEKIGSVPSFVDLSLPGIKSGQILVKVVYCGINHLDFLIQQGKRPGPKAFPHILGSEIVGIVENSSSGSFKKNDKVAIYPWTYCGKCTQCNSSNPQLCDTGGTIGRTTAGGYAEYIAVDEHNLVKLSEGADLQAVAAVVLAGTTAVHLIQRASISPQSLVLVTGASGGVGQCVIQLLKNMECTILATSSTTDKYYLLQKAGVSKMYSVTHFAEELKQDYPDGVDFVIDIMGGSVWSQALTTLKKNGTMSYCATTLDGNGSIPIGLSFSMQWNIHGSYGGSIDDMKTCIRSVQEKKVIPVIDSIFPLNEAANALQRIESKKAFGKVLLSVIKEGS